MPMPNSWRAFAIVALSWMTGLAHAQKGQDLQANYLAGLKQASCPRGVADMEPEPIDLRAAPVPLQGVNPGRRTIGDLTFVGGYHLTSSDPRFGGLSGLDVLEEGGLLAVSDAGSFVWVELAADGVTPVSARIADMRNKEGLPFTRKADADAEGLTLVDGIALVSFEGDHRVAAYDIQRCGAAARGALLSDARLPQAFAKAGLHVRSNEGVEALAITPDRRLVMGIEAKTDSGSAVSALPVEVQPEFNIRIGEGAPELVGLDIIAGEGGAGAIVAYSLHRSTNALASNVIVLAETVLERTFDPADASASEIDARPHERLRSAASRTLASMNLFVTIDNFEGIAAQRMTDGRVRLYVIADNNFSASQRTLLMVYDVAERD